MEYTLKKCQEVVDEWIQTIGIRYFSELTNIAILMEEVGELARIAAREYGDQSYKESDKSVNLAEEMADVLFVLVCLANQTGVDLEEAFRQSLEKKTKRDKIRHRENTKLFPAKSVES
jgi:NTP pyrophosphatase (non-canonical NTP hydrolase)